MGGIKLMKISNGGYFMPMNPENTGKKAHFVSLQENWMLAIFRAVQK
jgi:hypothetical protein